MKKSIILFLFLLVLNSVSAETLNLGEFHLNLSEDIVFNLPENYDKVNISIEGIYKEDYHSITLFPAQLWKKDEILKLLNVQSVPLKPHIETDNIISSELTIDIDVYENDKFIETKKITLDIDKDVLQEKNKVNLYFNLSQEITFVKKYETSNLKLNGISTEEGITDITDFVYSGNNILILSSDTESFADVKIEYNLKEEELPPEIILPPAGGGGGGKEEKETPEEEIIPEEISIGDIPPEILEEINEIIKDFPIVFERAYKMNGTGKTVLQYRLKGIMDDIPVLKDIKKYLFGEDFILIIRDEKGEITQEKIHKKGKIS